MTVILHIIIALTSIAYTGFTFFLPSQSKLKASYILVMATIASGTYLVLSKPAHMIEACVMGLLYLAFVSLGIVSTRHKLASHKVNN